MNRYQTKTPRAAFGVAAAALTALTFGLLVVAPAHVSSAAADAELLAAQRVPSTVPIAVTLERIEVVAQRGQREAVGLARHTANKQGEGKAQAI